MRLYGIKFSQVQQRSTSPCHQEFEENAESFVQRECDGGAASVADRVANTNKLCPNTARVELHQAEGDHLLR